jgi:polysaccharide deacetylase family protein (PEP-CTERM system associated)
LKNILSVDVEEWYHPEYVRNKVKETLVERVHQSISNAFQLLREYNASATFFVVGELVNKHPEIVNEINEEGHEVAFHGYYHRPLWELNAKEFQLELENFSSLVREKCLGFRAPSLSLDNRTKWVLKVLERFGYKYDSSVMPTRTPLYGVKGSPLRPYRPSYENVAKEDKNAKLLEFPLLVYPLASVKIPAAGGFYLRLFPVDFIKRAIKKANKQGFPAVIFFHPWELDPKTPRLKLSPYKSFVTYYNLDGMKKKLKNILSTFKFASIENHAKEKGLV